MATKQNYTQNYESGINSGIYWSIKPRQSWDKSYYYFSCVETNVYVMIKKIKKEYIVSFDDTELNAFRTLKECNPFIIAELNKLIIKRNEERIRIKKEKELKEAAEYAAKIERENAIIAEVKATVKLSYNITVCDNENLSNQLDKLLSNLAEKCQEKLNLPVIKEDYYGFYQDFSNFSVVELENGNLEFTAFIGEDIVQFVFNGHSSVNTAIINEIDKAIDNYIKTGKIKKSSGKKPALKIADKHNKATKRSKEAIALAALAKDIRNTCNFKNTKYSPLERMVSDMVRVVSVDGLLQVIAVDKFDKQSEEGGTIKTFTVGQTVGSIDLAIPKVMLSEILEGIGNTGLFNLFFEQKDNNLIITHRKGHYELIGLNSDELITLFHPNDLVVTETTPVIDITEGDNYILPSTQKVQLIETTVNDVIYCEVVPSNEMYGYEFDSAHKLLKFIENISSENQSMRSCQTNYNLNFHVPIWVKIKEQKLWFGYDNNKYQYTPDIISSFTEVTEITLDEMIGIDLIDSQLFSTLTTNKSANPIDNVKIIHVSDKITDITKSVIKPETIEFQQQITPIGNTDKKGYTQSRFLVKTTEGIKEKIGFVKGQIAIRNELTCDTIIHVPSGCKIASFNKGNVFVRGKKTTKKDVQIRVAKLVDALNSLDFIANTELNKLQCLICYVYMQTIISDKPLEESILSVIKMLEVEDEHNLLTLIKKYFNYEIEEVNF